MTKYMAVLVFALVPFHAFSAEPAGSATRQSNQEIERRIFDSIDIQTPEAVDKMIEFLLCGQDPKSWLCGEKNEQREEVSASIVSLAKIHKLPPLLLVVKFYLESRFDIHKIGKKLGEIGIPQVHGVAKRGCELASAHGQMECGAVYLRSLVQACESKTLQSALLVYMSGKCYPSEKVWAIAEYRLGLYFRLVKKVEKLYADGLLANPELASLAPEKMNDAEGNTSREEVARQGKPRTKKSTLDINAIVAVAREKAMRQ